MIKHYERSVDETKMNLLVGFRLCNHWKILATVPLQALPVLLDAEVNLVLLAVGVANMAQPKGVIS